MINFKDGCGDWSNFEFESGYGHWSYIDRGFYEYRAYFIAAAGISEFKECSRTKEIVEQVVTWSCGNFILHIKTSARTALKETNRVEAIATLIKLIDSSSDRYILEQAVSILWEIAIGNKDVIATLIKLIDSTSSEDIHRQALKSLGKIPIGNKDAIAALVKVIDSTNDEYILRQVADSLGNIDPGNEIAIAALVKVIDSTNDEYTRRQAADSLGKIDSGNAIKESQGFSNTLLEYLNTFGGAICIICDRAKQKNLQYFSPTQPQLVESIIGWIQRIVLEQ